MEKKKRKPWQWGKLVLAGILSAAMVIQPVTAFAVETTDVEATDNEVTADKTVRLKPTEASTFNDTNGDGLGEFEGWGTSLCWWANRIGYSEELTSQAAELFFSDEGLDMNIGRYNVGGGDDVADELTTEEISVNENAQFYDLETEGRTPEYSGTSMEVNEITAMQDVQFSASDADFGFTKGTNVGSFKAIGWINELGAEAGSGDNLHYTVNVDESGAYTVKLLLTLTGSNERNVAIRVNGEDDYVVDADTVNANIIASGNNNMLFVVTISDVELNAGDNTIDIGGVGDWTLDFVKMAVIKSGEEGVLPEEDEFLHLSHIIRSDGGVPGYCVDVTKIDLTEHDMDYYNANFDRADEECGYAWNYDWTADQNQINVLKAAIEASGTDFIVEAFSNSPPYFMTVSGCSSGNTDSSQDNLRSDSYTAFATYMADVIKHWEDEGIDFQSTDPMNEPYTNYWGAYSNKQEGCHFDQGDSQSEILVELDKALKANGIDDIIISASDETSIDTAITSYNALSDEAKEVVDRIDTHTYSGSDREGLKTTAQEAGTNLWMSEVDGAYTAGTNAGEMSAALGLAQRMMTDVNGLECSAWILWNAIDMHADSSETGQYWVDKGSANDYLTIEDLESAWGSRTSSGYWGLAAADHTNENIVLSMKYYAFGQFSRYIRPGYTIIGSNSEGTTLAAYDPDGEQVVIVAMNTAASDKTWKFDLSGFETMGTDITAIRTSGDLDTGEHWADVTDSDNIIADTDTNSFTATVKANSITTYIIEDVSGILPAVDENTPVVSKISVDSSQVTGGKVWNNGTVNVPQNVVDEDYTTYYDGVDADDGTAGYVMIDLGESTEVAAFSYAPRSGYADRMVGATIYGSDDGETWTAIYTIEATPSVGTDTMVYYTDFNQGTPVTYRYFKFERSSECNLSEFGVWELAPSIESQEAVTATTFNGSEPSLPDTVEATLSNGETRDIAVTWELSEVEVSWDEMELYDYIAVTGSSDEANGTVEGYILCTPGGLEYLIDCMSGDTPVSRDSNYVSEVWTAAQGLDSLLNTDSSDQAKTEDNTWGLTTDPEGLNTWAYDQGTTTPLYSYGYWASSDVSITYDLSLPAGQHDIQLGCYDFWSGRTMNVYYSVNGGEKELLCTLTSNHDTGSMSGGSITLEEDAVVTISVENGGDGDPVLGWISVNETAGSVDPVSTVALTDGETGLPDTLTVNNSNGTTVQANVTWNTSDIDFTADPFTVTEITGTVEGYPEVTATATVMLLPANLEYLIDCDNLDSEVWNLAVENTDVLPYLLNTGAADQAYDAESGWGYTSVVGTDITSKSGGTADDPYSGGWYAKGDKEITYQVTLPAGQHTIMLGCQGWWSMDREMDVYYTIGDGEETFLCDFDAAAGSDIYVSSDPITLEEESTVTITVKKAADSDPILSWLMVAGTGDSFIQPDGYLTAHYDMSHEGTVLKDISGNGNDAALYDTEDSDFAVYGTEEVLQFNNEQYATIPSGVIDDASSFTVQAVVSAPTTSNNWLWCFGDGIGQWGAGNIGDYIFVSPNSSESSYTGTVLAAVKVGSESSGGESRMPVPDADLGGGYTTITLVSDGTTLTMYMDGVEVSSLEHGKDVSSVIPDGDILGYIGQSLYSADKKLIANVSDIMIWNTALDAETVAAAAPTADEKADMVLADIRKAMLNENESEDEITSDIALPSSIDGLDLTWSIEDNTAITEDGTVKVPVDGNDVTAEVTVSFEGTEHTFVLTVPSTDIGDILDAALEQVDIPNKDDVRGNITLTDEVEVNGESVEVTWETTHPDIVDVNPQAEKKDGYGEVPAGVVTRPEEDTEVTMTATLSYMGETEEKEIVIQVKAAPEEISEEDYTDYFFAYFAGEGYSDGEQIYFASSEDGLNWDDLNNNEPVLTSTLGEEGVRDPFIIRSPEGDKFYLIATDLKIYGSNDWTAAQQSGSQSLMVWESTDLVNWSDQRMVEISADIDAGCTWAPEATYDPLTGEYVVYWSSKVSSDGYEKQRVYYAKTRDFYTFTEPQVYIDYDQSSIDTTMIEYDGTYYRFTKNEGGSTNQLGALTKTIFMESSDSVLGDFTSIVSDSLNENQWVEGPTIFKLNQDDAEEDTWCLLVDEFGGIGYYPLLTTDLESGEFTAPETGTYSMPSRARHGTPIRITSEEYEAIMAAYGTPDEVNTYVVAGETPELPDTVTVGGAEVAVTWNLDGVSFEGNPYSYVTVTGTVEGSTAEAIANVQIIPADVEYMIDCNNLDSETWENVLQASSVLLNTEAADQAKTEDNTWGYTGTVGSTNNDGGDFVGYSQTSTTNPYTGGWWAENGKDITYQVTLPAGDHQIMLGCTGWWSMGREMDVYYSVNGGEETKLCDFDAVNSQETYASGTITLDEAALVTLTVKKAASDDPILSWISVSDVTEPVELQITANPEDYAGVSGEMAVFTVAAEGTGLSYQWQYCNASSNIWRDSSMEGSNTESVSVPIASYRDGQKYRCIVTDAMGNTAVSEVAVISMIVLQTPVITEQPSDYTGTVGENALFELKAEGTGLTYQWQYRNASGGIWRNSSMAGSDTEAVSVPITAARDGQSYRCVVTGENGESVISNVVYLTVGTVDTTPVIVVQPEDFTGVSGETAQFSVQATGTGLSYQWQYCNASSTVWRNSSMEGSNTDTISVPVASYRNGQKYRCIITSEDGRSITSDAVVLYVTE